MSADNASSNPPASAQPLTAAMIGFAEAVLAARRSRRDRASPNPAIICGVARDIG